MAVGVLAGGGWGSTGGQHDRSEGEGGQGSGCWLAGGRWDRLLRPPPRAVTGGGIGGGGRAAGGWGRAGGVLLHDRAGLGGGGEIG